MKKFTILITRPAHQAETLCEKIRAIGGETILFPTIEIADPADKTSLLTAIKQLNHFEIAIFTSSNAVLKTMPLWPRTKLTNLKIIANGPATAKTLAEFTLQAIIPLSPFSSEMLLALPELQNVKNKKIAIFTGAAGRDLLAKTLGERGAEVHLAISYQRLQPQLVTNLSSNKINALDFILITSYDSLKNLLSMLADQKAALLTKTIIVISARLENLAAALGFQHILLAKNATDNAIIECLAQNP